MRHEQVDMGFSTADADDVRLSFDGADVLLECVDWQEAPQKCAFKEVLACRWGQHLGLDLPRDDCSYQIHDSDWLIREAKLAAVDQSAFAHYTLCFNAWGVFEVLARKKNV